MEGAPKDDRLARGQDCHLIKQPARLHWDNPTEMIDIIGICSLWLMKLAHWLVIV